MSPGLTETGRGGGSFPATSWTLILDARGEGGDARACLDRLISLYWRPVYWYVRNRWHASREQAKDLTQDFFATVLVERKALDDLRESRPRFRAFLRSCLENFLLSRARDASRQKRGGGAAIASLSVVDPDASDLDVSAEGLSPEKAFDRAWAQAILEDCTNALREIYCSTGREPYWRVFARYHLAGDEPSYEACATELGMKPHDVQNRLRHARRTLRGLVRERVRDTLANPDDLESELRLLEAFSR